MSQRECPTKRSGRVAYSIFRLYSPRRPQRDLCHPHPVQSLPPLRAFLRNEGIDADIDARLVGTTHGAAREEARRRALKAAATRYMLSNLMIPIILTIYP